MPSNSRCSVNLIDVYLRPGIGVVQQLAGLDRCALPLPVPQCDRSDGTFGGEVGGEAAQVLGFIVRAVFTSFVATMLRHLRE